MLPAPADVERLLDHVASGRPIPLRPGPAIDDLRREAERARDCLEELHQKRITVGILGGTGVGKSTLLNALAKAPISRPGDRRPTTDRAVVYRHRDFELPDWLDPGDLADPVPPHDADELRGVILLDLPDIDSLRGDHRLRVHRILPHLDLLIVMASVDKYGDEALYDEVRALPQARVNRIYLLNAVDRLPAAERDPVLRDFAAKLRAHAGVESDEPLAISALVALRAGNGDGGLAPLRKTFERLGGETERRRVLAANAREALRRVVERWRSHLPAGEIRGWLASLAELRTPAAPARQGGGVESMEEALEEWVHPWVADRAQRASWFPIGWTHFVLRRFRKRRPTSEALAGENPTASYAEEMLVRPLRIAALEAGDLIRRARALTLEVPALDRDAMLAEARRPLDPWLERLRARAPRWGWKLRQHLLPLLALVGAAAWVVAPALPPREGTSWITAIGSALWHSLALLSPPVLLTAGGSLVLYYLLVHPYFLYRLERKLQAAARDGARLLTAEWVEIRKRRWVEPYGKSVATVNSWFEQGEDLIEPLARAAEESAENDSRAHTRIS